MEALPYQTYKSRIVDSQGGSIQQQYRVEPESFH